MLTNARWTALSAIFICLVAAPLFAASEQPIYSFRSNWNGITPAAGLIFDASGNLYGTTEWGGGDMSGCGGTGCGVVFELVAGANGTWTEKILHNFNDSGKDGTDPMSALVFGANGALYGTTYSGGSSNNGTVFQLTSTNGKWTEKILHYFKGVDGANPSAGLVFDTTGNLYGTTYYGGKSGNGTVFELSPGSNGKWAEKVLYNFNGTAGVNPAASVIFDSNGNLYGTTIGGGSSKCAGGCGVVFELTHGASGWSEKVLHDFAGRDGETPSGSLVFDMSGNLYGTAYSGGRTNAGDVFELSPSTTGKWTETVLYYFKNSTLDGVNPSASLIFDGNGNLYSTTVYGGSFGNGTVFELSPAGDGKWTESIVYSFNNTDADGANPVAPVVIDANGDLFGTTSDGGTAFNGTAFEVTP
jgi:uncharacterized repeat protein (TIGR03803 family)